MYNELFAYLGEKDVKYKGYIKLSDYSSVKIGGTVDVAVFPDTKDKLVLTLKYLYANRYSFCIIGKMTNLLADDSDFSGVAVFTTEIKGYSIDNYYVSVECGALTSKLINELCSHSLGGLESLFGIPGTLGGMIYSNAGAYGAEISDYVIDVTVYDITNDSIVTLPKSELRFSYRHSIFKENKYLILLSARLLLENKDTRSIKEKMQTIIDKRKATQPLKMPSLGSVFKRYGGAPVSRLVDLCGLKGYRIGGAEVSEKHAGFIVNIGSATASDYKRIISYIKECIFDKFGLRIEEEIEYFGFLP